VLAPHTDDAELGCGGTIARFLEEGAEVCIVAFSTAEDSLPPSMPRTQLRDEFVEAMKLLGVPPAQVATHSYPVRKLSYHRQEVLEDLIRLRNAFSPEMVFGPASTDLHQDHQVLHNECMRAFKELTIFGYELPWNQVTFSANAFIALQARHIEAKWNALQAYKSQIELHRPYFTLEFVQSLALVRGVQVKTAYAEAFELHRLCL